MTGKSFVSSELECGNHAGVNAAAVCSVCGKPVCSDCCVQLDTFIVCDDRSHRMIAQQWSLLYRVESDFEADMIVANLVGNGIPAQAFSSRAFKLTIGENSGDGVNIFVSSADYLRAMDLLTVLELIPTLIKNQLLN